MGIRKAMRDSRKPHKFKPTVIPPGFVLVRDTREQTPLFTRTKGLTVLVDTLHYGDYSIKGFEDRFTVERKQESDFYSYIGKERKRTIEKLKQLSNFDFAALLLEGMNYRDLSLQSMYSKLTPEHVRGFLTSLNIKYGIHFFCDSRRSACERWILDRAVRFYRLMRSM